MAKRAPATEKITRDDLEAKFADLQSGIQGTARSKKSTLITAAGVGAVLLVLIVFLLGKRSGKRTTTLVEIRRV